MTAMILLVAVLMIRAGDAVPALKIFPVFPRYRKR